MADDLSDLVEEAKGGDQAALEAVVRRIQDRVHHLAMRMPVKPEDARDATQEILIRVITKLSSFEGGAAFTTWVYRVAVNYLLSAKKVLARDPGLDFEMFGADLEAGLVADPPPSAEDRVLLNELRISCTMAMLLCLDLKHRVAYVLGDILELDQAEAEEVLGITKDNYRKRLSRARAEVETFTAKRCGLADATAKCACPRRLIAALKLGRVRPDRIAYALESAPAYDEVAAEAKRVEGALKVLKLQHATPHFNSPEDFGAMVANIVARPQAPP